MDFKNALLLVNKFISGDIDCTPDHFGPLDEESYDIKEYLLEFNRRNILTLNSQPFYDGRGILEVGTVVQTPYVEGLCFEDMRDLMCLNADNYGYLYTTISMHNTHDDRGRSVRRFAMKSNHNGINLTVAYEPVSGTVEAHHAILRNDIGNHYKNIISGWDLKILGGQQLFWVFFSETSLPLERTKKGFVDLKRDNSFFENLLKVS